MSIRTGLASVFDSLAAALRQGDAQPAPTPAPAPATAPAAKAEAPKPDVTAEARRLYSELEQRWEAMNAGRQFCWGDPPIFASIKVPGYLQGAVAAIGYHDPKNGFYMEGGWAYMGLRSGTV